MAFIRPQKRLAPQPVIGKADLEAEIRNAVATALSDGSGGVGAYIYTSGVRSLSPPQASRLDHRNFTIRAGIGNSNKAVSTAVFPITIRMPNPAAGPVSYYLALPFSAGGVTPKFQLQLLEWTMAYGNGAPSAGSATLFYTPPNGSRVAVSTTPAWTAVGTGALAFNPLFSETFASKTVDAQGRLDVAITISSGTAKDFVATIWAKHKHVR